MKRGGFLKRTTPLRPKSTKQPKKEYAVQEFLRPSQIKKEIPAVKVYPDGREVCSNTKAGKDEYLRRLYFAWEKQGRLCGICGLPLRKAEASADHIRLRKMGGGSRDDSQKNISAVHPFCNQERGSKRAGYYDFDEIIP